jgi:hypothetical protein
MKKTRLDAYRHNPWPFEVIPGPEWQDVFGQLLPAMVFHQMCPCVEQGKTQVPADLAEHFSIEGGYPHLTVPFEGNEVLYLKFYQWMKGCCEHPFMEAKSATLGGVLEDETASVAFHVMWNAIEQMGKDRIPLLYRLTCDLGQCTAGSIAVEEVPATLQEIKVLQQHEIVTPFLIDSGTEESVIDDVRYLTCREPVLETRTGRWLVDQLFPRVDGEISTDGFRIYQQIDSDMDWVEVFHARRFEQKIIKPQRVAQDPEVLFTNLETGATFVTKGWISTTGMQDSQEFHVDGRKSDICEHVVDVVEKACLWVMETGQPAHYAGPNAIFVDWGVPFEDDPDPLGDWPAPFADDTDFPAL